MELLPKVEVQIQRAVCGEFYKSALSHNQQPCSAFILGSREDVTKPYFDFALIAVASESWNALDVASLVVGLEQRFEDVRQVAKDFQRVLILYDPLTMPPSLVKAHDEPEGRGYVPCGKERPCRFWHTIRASVAVGPQPPLPVLTRRRSSAVEAVRLWF